MIARVAGREEPRSCGPEARTGVAFDFMSHRLRLVAPFVLTCLGCGGASSADATAPPDASDSGGPAFVPGDVPSSPPTEDTTTTPSIDLPQVDAAEPGASPAVEEVVEPPPADDVGGPPPVDAGEPPPPTGAVPLNINVSTLLGLGDSVGKGCCTEGSDKYAFFKMLVANDDAKYPGWAGFDVTSTWVTLQDTKNLAKSGATSADVLDAQVSGLAPVYSAPTLITIHVGGNDFNDHKPTQFLTNPGGVEADGKLLGKHLDQILTVLEDPKRFPAGAFVFVATIFSPTDDQCSFTGKPEFDGDWCQSLRTLGCVAPGWVDLLAGYNTEIAAAVAKHTNAVLVDTHAAFLGHGMNAPSPSDIWFNHDCVHPNAAGHHGLRKAFFTAMTGLAGTP